MAISRLKKELISIQKTPPEYITVYIPFHLHNNKLTIWIPYIYYLQTRPLDTNILEWHFVIDGPKDSPYYKGQYHGKLKFPSEYPLKPPRYVIIVITYIYLLHKYIYL